MWSRNTQSPGGNTWQPTENNLLSAAETHVHSISSMPFPPFSDRPRSLPFTDLISTRIARRPGTITGMMAVTLMRPLLKTVGAFINRLCHYVNKCATLMKRWDYEQFEAVYLICTCTKHHAPIFFIRYREFFITGCCLSFCFQNTDTKHTKMKRWAVGSENCRAFKVKWSVKGSGLGDTGENLGGKKPPKHFKSLSLLKL